MANVGWLDVQVEITQDPWVLGQGSTDLSELIVRVQDTISEALREEFGPMM